MTSDTSPGPVKPAIEALRGRIKGLGAAKVLATQQDALRTRRQQLGDSAGRLAPLAAIHRGLAEAGLAASLPKDEIKKLHEATRVRRARFEAEPASITADPSDSSFRFEYVMLLDNLAPRIKERLTEAWREHVLDALAGHDDALLQVLGQIPGLGDEVTTLRATVSDLRARAERLPQQTDEIAAVERLSTDLRARWNALPTGGIDSHVFEFLTAATTSAGAPLAALDEPVKEWLTGHNLLDRLRVRFANRT